eukprot:366077-Chlamydomonas_euryale.AAC.4
MPVLSAARQGKCKSYRERTRRVCLRGANTNRRNHRRQEAQQRFTQNKYGRGSASARRHRRTGACPCARR